MMTAVLFTSPVQRFVVDVQEKSSVDLEPGIDDDGIRRDSAWWASSSWKRSVADLDPEQSLAVLGEPGVGKSTTIAGLVGDGPSVNLVHLDEATDVRLLRELLEPTVSASAAAGRPTLVLDGVDECPLPPKALFRHVIRAVNQRPEVRVVVGCRTGDWSTSLSDGLRAALGSFDVVELLPLSYEDIIALSSARGFDGEAFVEAVRRAGAGPLATLPLTLDLLLSLYSQGGLPTGARSLYDRGLLLLAGEPDRDRADEHRPAGSDAERLAVASRIAAALTLCGRSGVVLEGQLGAADLAAGDLAGGSELLPAGPFAVEPELVEGTLATALFSGRGPSRFGIGHASFAAYLTARFLTAHGVPEHQLRALLTITSSLGRTSVPTRLRETVAWLVALDPERNQWLVKLDPGALVAHSALISDPRVREALAAYLLDVGDPDRAIPRRRWRLAHPGLADQLRPALRAPLAEDAGPHFGNPVSRRANTAIEIARSSDAQELVPEIEALVLRADLNSYLRGSAAHGLADLDSDRAVAALRGVLDEVMQHSDHDPEDELRGIALGTCWPKALAVTDLLLALTAPKNPNFFGSYQFFLRRLVEKLTDEELVDLVRAVAAPAATLGRTVGDVTWVDEDDLEPATPLLRGTRRDERLLVELVNRALKSSLLATILDEAGWLLAQAMRRHQSCTLPARFMETSGSAEAEDVRELRRGLVLPALRYLDPVWSSQLAWRWHLSDQAASELSQRSRPGLIKGSDLAWLFSLETGPYQDHARALIRAVFDPDDLAQQAIAWGHRSNALFAGSIGHWFEPVDIAGPVAERMRQDHAWTNREPSWEGADAHAEAIAEAWARCRGGDAAAFFDLCLSLRTDPQTGRFEAIDDSIAAWPSAHLLDAEPDELALAARAYLATDGVISGDWPEADSITYGALQGYAALGLFARRSDAQAWFDELPDEVWAGWTPAIIRCPATGDEASETVKGRLLEEAATRVPAAFAEAYLSWVEQAAAAGRSLPHLAPLATVYQPEIGGRLSALVSPLAEAVSTARHALTTLSSESGAAADQSARNELVNRMTIISGDLKEIAEFLCMRRHQPTISILQEMLGTAETPGAAVAEVRTAAAIALLVSGAVTWSGIFPVLESDEEFGRSLVNELARRRDEAPTQQLTSDNEIASLWRWVAARWGTETNDFADGFETADHPIRNFKDSLLAELAQRSTPAALHALADVAAAYPGDLRIASLLREAETRQRDDSWLGPTLSDLMALVADARRTVVHDEDDLYRLVLSVLQRVAIRLQTHGQFLWNESRSASDPSKLVWRPKYESAVSAFIQDHIELELADRLVVNREVLVRQTTERGHGLSVDVLASGGGSGEATERLPRCPLEVKGSWNDGLLTDLEAQLVGDYLPALNTTRGIFVCAWFPVEMWDDDADNRRRKAATRDRDAVRRSLEEAASRVSSTSGVEVAAVLIDVPRPIASARKSSTR
ncbi:hypothetical protein F1C76_00700 [Geodermatophilaceae bacterium NBWT11]|nr:hypothetical protein F1C76_00700 [Geodermatophilaceae bacterium NBWT11]